MHDALALTGEGGKAVDRNTGFAGNLRQPGQLARPVLENHCQVRGHRIFDLSTAPGTRAIRTSPAGSVPQDRLVVGLADAAVRRNLTAAQGDAGKR